MAKTLSKGHGATNKTRSTKPAAKASAKSFSHIPHKALDRYRDIVKKRRKLVTVDRLARRSELLVG